MLTHTQKFVLPTMPFRREIPSGLPVGSSVVLTGKPYEDAKKSVELTLSTNNNDIALRVELILGQPSRLKIDCTVSQKTSPPVENLVISPYNQDAKLRIKAMQHSFQILFNETKIADFVHRVDPNLIKLICIKGPFITSEVIIEPAGVAALPSYEQATSPPVDLMNNLNLGAPKVPLTDLRDDLPPPPASVLHPTTVASQVPIGAGVSAPPAASGPSTASSSFFYTGNSQGFSAHPYPLPGLIDNNTYASQQNPAGPLPAQTVPSAPPVAPVAPVATGAFVSTTVSHPPSNSSIYADTPITSPSVPYTVTYPQSGAPTPAAPPLQRAPVYQNQMQMPMAMAGGYYPSPPPPPQMAAQQVPIPSTAMVPAGQAYPQMTVPPAYMYPAAAPLVQPIQPYPVYQQYPGYYPEVVYYDGGHHHHHHRHHFFGHHHHHCD
ncbi:unnamed protein product [Caenorhabditis sp. 36 PRJEB53466]|nr:unnamed protein product [Caenorhabditis sp. 36 PRJEB53466]